MRHIKLFLALFLLFLGSHAPATAGMVINPYLYASGGGVDSPDDLDNLEVWLDASDDSSVTHSSNSVSQWNDLSGNGRHFTQGTSAEQPTYNNGSDYIEFDGSDDELTNGNAVMYNSSNGGSTFIAVVDNITIGNTDTLFAEYDNAGSAFYSIARFRGDHTPTPQSVDDASGTVINDNQLDNANDFERSVYSISINQSPILRLSMCECHPTHLG